MHTNKNTALTINAFFLKKYTFTLLSLLGYNYFKAMFALWN